MATKRVVLRVGILTLLWWGFCAIRYSVENGRVTECIDLLVDTQSDICVRNAIEARDSILAWAIGLPVGTLIAAAFITEILRIARGRR